MQRKKVLYLVAILAILLAALPLSASAQPAAPHSAAAESVGNEALPTALDAKLASDGPAAPAAPAVNPAAVIYDNGSLVTNPGAGAGGADASAVQTALLNSTYGFGHAISSGYRVADDFTVPAGGWTISTITFYAYQTGSTTTSTINNVNLRIWDGVPGVGNVVFGDTSTNRLAGSSFSNIYRVLDTGLTNNQRPIMADVVTVNTTLPAGTYWLDWQTGGTLSSGPWAPPVTLLGQTAKPGANGMQFDPTTGTWGPLVDTGNGTVQDLPFVIDGPVSGPAISLAKTVGATPGVCATTSNITVPEGTTVYYCYTVTNTGDTTLNTHDLSDDQLGTIFTGVSYALTPGSSVSTIDLGVAVSAVLNTTTTNVGTWTAYNVGGAQASAQATAVVNVTPNRCPAGSNEVTLLTEGFDGSFPPAGWTLANTTTGCSGIPDWTNTDPSGRGNLTGGTGMFAIADSDACGSGSVMNAQMWTAPLDLTGLTDPMVSYYTDYNDISSASDVADLDYSTDGGATWSNILSWNEDHRGPLLVEEPFAADGQANTLVRWNYTNATWDWWWQVDSVAVTACEPSGDAPNIFVDPLSMASTQATNTQVQQTLTISNTGGGTLNWLIDEENNKPQEMPSFVAGSSAASAGQATNATPANMPAVTPAMLGSNAYSWNSQNGPYYTVFDIDVPSTLPNIAAFPANDFVGAGEYVNGLVYMVDGTNTMFEVNPATGAINNSYPVTAPPGGQTYSGLALDPTTGIVYASSTDVSSSALFTIVPSTGVATLIGSLTGSAAMIAISFDGAGNLYGYDIVSDSMYSIDKTNGAIVNLGALPFDANDFGQGMGYDPATDTVYLAAFNNGTFQAELWTYDPGTNSYAFMGVLGSVVPGGLNQLSWLGFAGGPSLEDCSVLSDIPWLSLDAYNGSNAGGTDTDVTVTFDSTGYGPGTYTGNLCITSNDPDTGPGNETDLVIVPVEMTVAEQLPFYCNMPDEGFENGVPPAGWTVVNNVPGGASWGDIAACSPSGNGGNWTGGSGNAACMSPGTLEPPHAYDAELRSPMFSLVGQSSASARYLANYQSWAGNDWLNFDISADGGATWTTLRSWNNDYGAFQSLPGVSVWVDLTPYVGQSNLMLRWHYFWNDPQAIGWYAQVDNVKLDCTELPPTAVTLNSLSTEAAQLPAPLASLPLASLPAAAAAALGAAFIWRRQRD